MSQTNELATTTQEASQPSLPAVAFTDPLAFLTNGAAFNHLWRIATGYSRSGLVPMQFQRKVDDCFIICQLAVRMNVDPFMLMQSTYIVHGRPGFEAKLAIALLNASGKIKGTLKTEFSGTGDDYGCRAWCIDAVSGERVQGPRVDWKMVKAEGWHRDKGTTNPQKSKWVTMPDLMFRYRAASYLIRTNYPEVLMGMTTKEELEDSATASGNVELTNQTRLELLLTGAPENARQATQSPAPASDDPVVIEANHEGAAPDATAASELASETAPTQSDPSEEIAFNELLAEVAEYASIADCARGAQLIHEGWTAERQEKAKLAIEQRKATLRAHRGERSNRQGRTDGGEAGGRT